MNVIRFSRNFKKLRLYHGWTQETIAEKCGVTRESVAKWECESMPGIDKLPIICEVLNVTADELLFEPLAMEQDKNKNDEILAGINELLARSKNSTSNVPHDLYQGYEELYTSQSIELELEGDIYYDAGTDEYGKGRLSDALYLLDHASELGNISAIKFAISVRKEIMSLVGDDCNEYLSQLSEFGNKLQEYGKIINASLQREYQ